MAVRTSADELRGEILRLLAHTPDVRLGQIVRSCRTTRGEAARTLDELIRDGLVRFRHPWLVRLFGPLMSLFVGAERYSLTQEGLWAVAREPDTAS